MSFIHLIITLIAIVLFSYIISLIAVEIYSYNASDSNRKANEKVLIKILTIIVVIILSIATYRDSILNNHIQNIIDMVYEYNSVEDIQYHIRDYDSQYDN